MINGHGNNLYQYEKGAIEIDFSSNIAFNNKSDKIIEFISKNLNSIKNYPDPSAVILTEKIADFHSVLPSNVMVVNGSAEAFYLIAHLLSEPSCNTLIFTPSFAEYEDSCSLYNHKIDYQDIGQFYSVDLINYKSLWIGSPNNPNGFRVTSSEIIEKCLAFPNCYFVVDKAYNDLAERVEVESEMPENLILINSLTKSFGIPGIRLGYVIASSETISRLINRRQPWSVNALSLLAGEYVMDNYKELQLNKEELLRESHFMQRELSKIDGLRVIESSCNFFLCELCGEMKVAELQLSLVEKYGILIRDASNFRGLSDRYFRVAAQPRRSCERLISALRELL